MSTAVHPGSTSALISRTNDVEWRYEMRRDCQEIFPGLLLGPFQASKDLERMKSLGITHVACIRDVKEAFSVKPRFPGELQYLVLDVEDNEEQNLIRLFPRIFDRAKAFIDNALQSGGRVLVHCNSGISLSPSFVIMYVMERFQLAWDDALQMVQNRRYCISPNNGFITQIKEYESIYKAQRAIQSAPDASRPAPTRRKREDDDEEAEESDTRRRPEPTEMQQKDIDMT
ncbi:Dual specificity phosphatase, catalytic domain [Rhizoctonia solani]|uniref:Dual specificity phosphatase, catalytic domain n=1 Tax=Rhizoctonia solani TaxID=456999 RepID=A0A8H7HET3_9AGAM|nr:Dual specificity phosphatase, catalytic domain [Rhizoctonia solani]